ncbi:MAG TPA: ABC transporter ATP-binding protein [Steroidobacteraceae bacterium]|jgi:HlyD family secretion protein|nr:ABC transporter ATP-binding protein [Steroidobacteraceae bacterium]
MKTVRAFWILLPPHLRHRCLALLGLALVMAATTVAGLVSVMPFFQLLSASEATPTTRWLQGLRAMLGIADERVFLGAAAAIFVLTLIVANVINYFGTRSMHAFALCAADAIRVRLFGVYLRSDYLFHTRHDGARLANDVLYESDRVAALANVGFQAVTATGVVALIAVSLFIMNPWVSLVTLLVFGSAYALIFAHSRRQLRLNSIELTRESARRATLVRQAFAAIKELLVMRLDAPFQRQFGDATARVSRSQTHTHAIGLRPKYVLECLAAFALVTVALVLHVGGAPWLPQLTFLALSAYRLLPSLQQLFAGLVTVRAHREVLFRMLQSVEEESASGGAASVPQLEGAPARDIVFEDVSFRYAVETPAVFEHLNLRIRAGETIGVAGQNGSGKSSFADLLLGLLAPTSGRILVDGIDIGGRNRAAWQATIAYVPQHTALIDGTVMENIALGLAPEDVDQARLEAATRIARVDEFVAAFPQGYRTLLGEQGVQLSGGQRQRLGIARALYRRAKLLVMDEATASLDVTAEREITSALHDHASSTTLVIIAHRRSALAGCDRVFQLRDGRFTSEKVECA